MAGLLATRRRALVAAAAALAALLLAGRVLVHAGAPSAAPPPVRIPVAAPAAPTSLVVVDVVGAVRRPGLYRLHDGSRVADALARAGGAAKGASLDLVNLAAPLADGEQVVVPRAGARAAATASPGAPAAGPVQLSTATVEQLDALPGIGPVTAQKIVDFRSAHGVFHSVDELDAIPGIGPSRIDQLRGLVVP